MNRPEANLYSSTVRSKFMTARGLVHEFGWRKFLGKILPWLFVRRYIYYSELIQDLVSVSPSQVPFRLELAEEKDLPSLMTLRSHYYKLPLLQKRISEGHHCFLGWSGDKPIHVRWMFVKSLYLPYLHRTFLLSSGEVYADEAYTAPEFRRKGIFAYAGYLLRLKLRELGYNRYTCVFASWQMPSRKLAERIGLKKVGEVKIVNWPGCRRFYWKGLIQDHGDGKISLNCS